MVKEQNQIVRLKVKNLSVAYQTRKELVRAVTNVSFELKRGGSLGLWGHSGCGKSTIMKALLALPIDEPGWIGGHVQYNNQPISPDVSRYIQLSPGGTVRKNSVGFYRDHRQKIKPILGSAWRSIFQEPIYSFDSERSIGVQTLQILSNLAENEDSTQEDLLAEFMDILARLDLKYSYIFPKGNRQLSGGECQRIAFALAVVGKPELLLADEPTTALDYQTRAMVTAILAEKVALNKMSLLIATHNREELPAMVENVIVLCHGILVESFSVRRLLEDASDSFHPYTRKLWFAIGDKDDGPPDSSIVGKNTHARCCPYYNECSMAAADPALAKLCQSQMPPMVELESDHSVACWIYKDRLPSAAAEAKEV